MVAQKLNRKEESTSFEVIVVASYLLTLKVTNHVFGLLHEKSTVLAFALLEFSGSLLQSYFLSSLL